MSDNPLWVRGLQKRRKCSVRKPHDPASAHCVGKVHPPTPLTITSSLTYLKKEAIREHFEDYGVRVVKPVNICASMEEIYFGNDSAHRQRMLNTALLNSGVTLEGVQEMIKRAEAYKNGKLTEEQFIPTIEKAYSLFDLMLMIDLLKRHKDRKLSDEQIKLFNYHFSAYAFQLNTSKEAVRDYMVYVHERKYNEDQSLPGLLIICYIANTIEGTRFVKLSTDGMFFKFRNAPCLEFRDQLTPKTAYAVQAFANSTFIVLYMLHDNIMVELRFTELQNGNIIFSGCGTVKAFLIDDKVSRVGFLDTHSERSEISVYAYTEHLWFLMTRCTECYFRYKFKIYNIEYYRSLFPRFVKIIMVELPFIIGVDKNGSLYVIKVTIHPTRMKILEDIEFIGMQGNSEIIVSRKDFPKEIFGIGENIYTNRLIIVKGYVKLTPTLDTPTDPPAIQGKSCSPHALVLGPSAYCKLKNKGQSEVIIPFYANVST
jgi:hypothetical protein